MCVTKAILAAGGLGTRMLPATKAVPKALLPVVDKPLLRWAIEEVLAAGIEEIAVLMRPDQVAIEHELATSDVLTDQLTALGKEEIRDTLLNQDKGAEIRCFGISDETSGIGKQILDLGDFLGEQPFAVLLVDELCPAEGGPLEQLIALYQRYQTSVCALVRYPHDDELILVGQVTKMDAHGPKSSDPNRAESKGARFIGRGVFTPELLRAYQALAMDRQTGLDLLDGMQVLATHQRLLGLPYKGEWWDCGDKTGYLQAQVALAARDPELGPGFRAFLDRFTGTENAS